MNCRRSRVYAAPVPRMPPGLVPLMEGLSRDVLTNSPIDIYQFCADHMRKLLQVRTESQRKTITPLQQKISKAQNIIRERADQRSKYYETNCQHLEDKKIENGDFTVNSPDIQPSHSDVHSGSEDAPDAKSEISSQQNVQETIVNECIAANLTSPRDDSICQSENVTDKEITINKDVDECHSQAGIPIADTHLELTSRDNGPTEKNVPQGNTEDCRTDEPNECHLHDASVGNAQNQMDLEAAAVTIQKVFRNFLFKSKTSSLDDATKVDINLLIDENNVKNDNNTERRGLSRMDTVLQTVNEEKSLSLSTDDSSTLSSAATVIQAHVRGFLVRNKLNVNKTPTSVESVADESSCASSETNNNAQKTKTILNIHIVPEKERFVSRDESFMTSMDLPMDDNHPHSMALHASNDITERRKQLKREDAIQSVTPPSSKLSEDIDSVREMVTASGDAKESVKSSGDFTEVDLSNGEAHELHTAVEKENNSPNHTTEEADPHVDDEGGAPYECEDGLRHSSEFQEVVLPTKVSRSDTSIVREFHNVLAYLLLWD